MESSFYQTYRNCLRKVLEQLEKEAAQQQSISEEERGTVSRIESGYQSISQELIDAKNAVREQYKSVRESCSQYFGLTSPSERRPLQTELSWKEAVHKQEQIASIIKDLITIRVHEAVQEREKALQEAARRKAAEQAALEEARRRKAEEEAKAEEQRAKELVEAFKQRHRKKR